MGSDELTKTSKIISPFTREKVAEFFASLTLNPEQLAFRDVLITRLLGNTALPALPTSFLKLQQALDNPKTTREEILEIIATDTGIVSKILAVSQSVIYGGSALSSLDDAVMRIGLKEVRKIAMAGGVVKALSDFDDGVDWNSFWVRSIVVARLVENISGAFRDSDGVSFLTGLLHDIGRIFMRHHFPEVYHPVMQKTEELGDAYAAEEAVLGMTRAPISAVLSKKWGLDPKITLAIHHQRDPLQSFGAAPQVLNSAAFLACCLNLAVNLADLSGLGITKVDSTIDDFQNLPSYQAIMAFTPIRPVDLQVEQEIERARAMVGSLAA